MYFPPELRWAGIVLAAALLYIWHYRQQRRLVLLMRRHNRMDKLDIRLLTLSGQRSWQAVFVLGVLLAFSVADHRAAERIKAERDDWQMRAETAETAASTQDTTLPAAPKPDLLSEEMQEKLDKIKERYEELFVNYYYLKHCNLADSTKFHSLNSLLVYELSLIDAPAGLRNSVLQAARGTYREMYEDAPCEPSVTQPMQAAMNAYLTQSLREVYD